MLIAGFGRKGHAVGGVPGVRFKVVKVFGVSISLSWLSSMRRRGSQGLKRRDLSKPAISLIVLLKNLDCHFLLPSGFYEQFLINYLVYVWLWYNF